MSAPDRRHVLPEHPAMPEMAFKIEEVALLLKCGRTKAVELILSGEIPSVKIRGVRRVRRADFEAWLAGLEPDIKPKRGQAA